MNDCGLNGRRLPPRINTEDADSGGSRNDSKARGAAPYAVVVGAVNLDVGGRSLSELVRCDSNPGHVAMSIGGVGHNIALNLARLGIGIRMITAFGGDALSDYLKQEAGRSLDISLSLTEPSRRCSSYLYVCGPDGNMDLAINDMDVMNCVTSRFIDSLVDALNSAELVVFDANLPEETITHISDICTRPMLADTVSTIKASRLRGALHAIDVLKPNLMELESLSGIAVRDERSLRLACAALVDAGAKNLLVSMGAKGAMVYNEDESFFCRPPEKLEIKNATGAGDALMAGFAFGRMKGQDSRACLRHAVAASLIAAMSDEAVSPDIDESGLDTIAKELRIDERISGLFE